MPVPDSEITAAQAVEGFSTARGLESQVQQLATRVATLEATVINLTAAVTQTTSQLQQLTAQWHRYELQMSNIGHTKAQEG